MVLNIMLYVYNIAAIIIYNMVCTYNVYYTYMYNSFVYIYIWGFPGGSDGKASACNAGDQGSIPGLGRSPGEGNGNPLQHSCLENPMDRGA